MACAARSWSVVSSCFHVDIEQAVYSPDDSVGAFADYILNIVLLRDVEGNLPGATASCGRHSCGCWTKVRFCAIWWFAVCCCSVLVEQMRRCGGGWACGGVQR
jgi:hypothetical protein